MHAGGRPAEIHRRLAGRIAAADDHRLRSFAVARLDLGRGIVNAGALELGETVDRQPPILDPGRHDDGAAADALAAVERRAERAVV